jgi:putative ABC transport system substrate-binding protein
VTGLSVLAAEISAKQLQMLKEAIPSLTRVAVLWNPNTQWHAKAVEHLKAVAPSLSIALSFVSARAPEEFAPAFGAVRRARAQAISVLSDALFGIHRMTLLGLASKAHLPDIYAKRHFTDEGGLMSYGANYADHWRRSAGYVDKLLKGAKPADLPIQQATKFEFVINLRTAKALGLTIPQSVLLQADDVVR